MDIELLPLPYAVDALEPHISARTVSLHYEKHHRGYLEKLRKIIEGKPGAQRDLEDLIRSTTDHDVFNNAAQVWNHTFYWMSLAPGGGGRPSKPIADEIDRSFGSFGSFERQLAEAANGEFGSGWAWLIETPSGRLRVVRSTDAQNPVQTTSNPLLAIDVWEHAYYLDYQNERDRYVEGVIDHLINWDFVATNLQRTKRPRSVA